MSRSSGGTSRKKRSDRPTIREINIYGIRDGVATDWHNLGVQLIPDHLQSHLGIIRADNPGDAKKRCTIMFDYWLQVDNTASWDKLIEALRNIHKNQLADIICKDVLQEKSSSENDEETEVNNQRQSSVTKNPDTCDPPNRMVAVGKQQNKNSTNDNHPPNKANGSTIWTKTTWIILIVITVSAVIFGVYYMQEEDGNFVPKSTYQKGNTSIEPKSTSQGLQDASSVLKPTYQKQPISNEPKPTTQGLSKEYEMFKKYYYKLSNILPTKNILDKLISKEIITRSDREEIDGISRLQDKTSKVLGIVDTALEAGYTDHFYSLLTIMEEYGKVNVVTKLANEIRESLK